MENTNKKYMLEKDTPLSSLYRIVALRQIDNPWGKISPGERGGYVESEDNLSQDGECWIYDASIVKDNARVSGQAAVKGDSKIEESARIEEEAFIGDSHIIQKAKVRGRAYINSSTIYGMADIFGHCTITNSDIGDYAMICGIGRINGSGIYDTSTIYACNNIYYSRLFGNCKIMDNAYINNCVLYNTCVKQSQHLWNVKCNEKFSRDLKENIRCQTNLMPEDNYVIAYKIVDKNMNSFYDSTFHYEVGKIVQPPCVTENDSSCASGLHFSNPNYWTKQEDCGYILKAKIMLDDIVTVQQGKIRCRRAEILAAYSYNL